ncbi:DUF6220 domain-containing protein [Brucella pseudogrignonensis]|uniref:DUF6220 domain-containing protein n=1 Tax=Brucella pseudogrignonensis TaxID=419475 RepID=UPI00124D236C|nr:DUF6220 domain-containing protein [Brucella pseudogrignonensis]KAB2684481.1 hypothetical protein F9K82_22860 [Brucella pseudogrignonensis]
MTKTHNTINGLHLGTPRWFVLSARLLPLGILTQFLTAGMALFSGVSDWALHKASGVVLSLPIILLLVGTLSISRLSAFNWWIILVFLLYIIQVGLASTGSLLTLAFHPLNGALLLIASLVLVVKIERRLAKERIGFPSQ